MKIASKINEQCIFELFVWKLEKEQMSIGSVVFHLFVHVFLNQAAPWFTFFAKNSEARNPIVTPTSLGIVPKPT